MKAFRGSHGLTLVEMISALLVFSLVTIGITPLVISSLQGSARSRSLTVGKNLAVQAMERVRGLPFFESVKGQVSPTRRDVLDLYFPDMGTGYNAGTFTTVCTETSETPSPSAPLACPAPLQDGSPSLPDDYSITYRAQFVKPGAVPGGGGAQDFVVVTPPSGYSWASLSTEIPPAPLLRLVIRAQWPYGGSTKSFELSSLISERQLSPDNIRADATVDFTIQAVTSYVADDGRVSTLTAKAGRVDSIIEARAVSSADQEVRAGQLTIAQEEFAGQPGQTLQDLSGAAAVLHAPPDSYFAPSVTAPAQTVTYQTSPTATPAQIANLAASFTSNVGVKVVDELPTAEGTFGFDAPTSDPLFWVNNQAETGRQAELLLDPNRKVLTVRRDGTTKMTAYTQGTATALTPTSGRKVAATATAVIGRVDLMPATFINQEQRAVVVIRDFKAELRCTSTAQPTASVAGIDGGTVVWSAKFKYWADTNNNNKDDGAYVPEMTISGSFSTGTPTADPLEAIQAQNPKVYDIPNDANDIHLFSTPATPKGYLVDWSSKPDVTWSKDASGRVTGASLDGALGIVTNRTHPNIEAAGLNVNIGKLSCEAVDKRGA